MGKTQWGMTGDVWMSEISNFGEQMEKKVKTHKDLEVWQRSVALVTEIYKLTSGFPTEEKFGLDAQIRKSSVSIASNIFERAARNSTKIFISFLNISLGSLSELETQLMIANNLGFLKYGSTY